MSVIRSMDGPVQIGNDPETRGRGVTLPEIESQETKSQNDTGGLAGNVSQPQGKITGFSAKVLGLVPQAAKDKMKEIVGSTTKQDGVSNDVDTDGMHSYDDVIRFMEDRMSDIHIPSKEELEKIRRRQKTEGIINSISDMSRALSNLFATSQYAPNGYQGNIMTDTMQKRFDREKAEMDANADKYYNYAMTVGKLKDYVEQQKYQRGRDKISDGYKAAAEKRAQEQADFERSLDPFKYQEQGYKTLKALYDSDKSKTDATYAPLKQEADIVLTKAKTKTEKHRQGALDASARNSIAAAAAHNRSNLLEYTAEDEHGNKKQFANKNAAVAYAKSHHTYVNEGSVDADSNTYDDNGNLISKGSAKQKYGGYAMITDDTMPGTGSKGVMPGVK